MRYRGLMKNANRVFAMMVLLNPDKWGLTPEEATVNLNAMNANFPGTPWLLSFSYGRALQQTVLQALQGKAGNVAAAQQALLKRARLNGAAQRGEYLPAMELSN